ncbi:MAG: SDR family NAD(P)-dependent oxidoreductase, partial [Polyangiaceae bacterium]
QMLAQLAVNFEAPVMLIKQAIPLLKKAPAPIVVIVTTGLVYAPMSITGSYCASKAAAHVMATVLHHLLAAEGIRVVESLPPSVDTELNFAAEEGNKMSADEFAKSFLSKLEHGHDVINVGQSALLEKLSRLSPRMAFWMLNRGTPHEDASQ